MVHKVSNSEKRLPTPSLLLPMRPDTPNSPARAVESPSACARFAADLQETAVLWRRKPLLRLVYRRFYELIDSCCRHDLDGQLVEIGAGCAGLKTLRPDCIATESFRTDYADRIENIYALTFPESSVTNLVLFDVLHHLENPGDALSECARVLVPGGRVVMLEPDIGLLGLLVYGLVHHEPLGVSAPICWNSGAVQSNKASAYYAAQANAHRIFVRGEYQDLWRQDWRLVKLRRLAAISYVASGGYRGWQLYPMRWYPLLRRIDSLLNGLPALFSTRLLVVLEKKQKGV